MLSIQVTSRSWVLEAVWRIRADFQRSSDTHSPQSILPPCRRCGSYLKDESTHPNGQPQHRLQVAVPSMGCANGWIQGEGIDHRGGVPAARPCQSSPLARAPSGPALVAADAAAATSAAKIAQRSSSTAAAATSSAACAAVSPRPSGWRASATATWTSSPTRSGPLTMRQQQHCGIHLPADASEPHPTPAWIVSAGTGGTSATIGC